MDLSACPGCYRANGPVDGIEVALPPQLAGCELRLPSAPESRARAVRATLGMLDLAPEPITFPLVAGIYRAALAEVDFSLFLTGRTGVFKTALAALAQQHFGARICPGALPGNFSSTGNALELLAFHAKDALFVVDDLAPAGRTRDCKLQAVAERLFRAAGNGQGRSRMGGDGCLQPQRAPRGLVLGTGEEIPAGQSIRARMLILEVAPGDVRIDVLTACQHAASAGLFATTMGGFVRWIAGDYEMIQARLRERAAELRAQLQTGASHVRTPGIIGELQAGFEVFTSFAVDAGAITATQRDDLVARCWQALRRVALQQGAYLQAADPACASSRC